MVICVIGAIITLVATFLLNFGLGGIAAIICFSAGVITTIFLAVLPLEGYLPPHETTINLLNLHRDVKEDKVYYVQKTDKTFIYAIDNRKKYSLTGEAYEENSIAGKVKLYESRDCEQPILKKFVTKPYRDELTFSNLFTKTEYVFYVPIGTVLREKEKRN